MSADVIMPALGMAQDTGTVLRWLRAEGEQVVAGDAVVEVETDKATVELEAPISGTLAGVRAGEGDQVPVGAVIAVVLAAGEQPAAARPSGPVAGAGAEAAAAAQPAAVEGGRRTPLASPKARRIASELAIDLDGINGSGPRGAIVAADVTGRAASPTPAPAQAPVSEAWRIMARRTTSSWQEVPHFFLHRELDASALERWRVAAARAADPVRVSHTDLLVRIVADALSRHRRVNAVWRDGAPALEPGINVGIAVATEQALVVPVIHAADTLPVAAIAARRHELVGAAREGRLRPADLADGTFTISNLGMYGVDSFDAIVNAPQAAILAVGRITDRVVAVAGSAVVRPTVQITLSFDHRMVDGARGAEFLQTLADLIEEPLGLIV